LPVQFSIGTLATEPSSWRFVAEQTLEFEVPPTSKDIQGRDLERVNAELKSSLEHCRALLAECRSKLAANEDSEPPKSDAERRQNPA